MTWRKATTDEEWLGGMIVDLLRRVDRLESGPQARIVVGDVEIVDDGTQLVLTRRSTGMSTTIAI